MFFHARVIYQIEKTVTNNCIHCHEELIIQPQHNKSATVVLNLWQYRIMQTQTKDNKAFTFVI